VTPVSSVKGAITTLEGLASGGRLHPIQQAWIDEQVPACGYCQNGQMLTAVALLQRNPRPTDAQIREAMAPVLCRCFTYYRIQAAIKRLAGGAAPTASLDESSVRGVGPTASLNQSSGGPAGELA
jgi:aerobic-type carbon monoxide dehydrogenase small subunit (CoxS/CutS family)